MRLKIVQDYGKYVSGQIVKVTLRTAKKLMALGVGVMSKDMTSSDIRKKVKK